MRPPSRGARAATRWRRTSGAVSCSAPRASLTMTWTRASASGSRKRRPARLRLASITLSSSSMTSTRRTDGGDGLQHARRRRGPTTSMSCSCGRASTASGAIQASAFSCGLAAAHVDGRLGQAIGAQRQPGRPGAVPSPPHCDPRRSTAVRPVPSTRSGEKRNSASGTAGPEQGDRRQCSHRRRACRTTCRAGTERRPRATASTQLAMTASWTAAFIAQCRHDQEAAGDGADDGTDGVPAVDPRTGRRGLLDAGGQHPHRQRIGQADGECQRKQQQRSR